MANLGGIGALIQGLQQGYGFVKDEQRKDSAETRAQEEFNQKKKGWTREDEYLARRKQIMSDGEQSAAPAEATDASASPAQQPVAAAGVDAQAAAPATPADSGGSAVSAPAPAMRSSPVVPSTAQLAATTGTGPAPAPAKPVVSNANSSMDKLIKLAQLDLEMGKTDGQGVLSLQKTIDSMKREGADRAIKLMHEGRMEEAQAEFDKQGDHKFGTIISVQDGTYEAGKVKLPTKIVKLQMPDGSQRVMNTAQTLYQQQDMDKIMSQAQKARETDVTEQHGKDVIDATKRGQDLSYKAHMASVGVAQQQLNLTKEQFNKQSLNGQIEQLEKVIGPLDPQKRQALGLRLAGLGKDDDATGKFIDAVVTEGVKAGTVKTEDAMRVRTNLATSITKARDEGIIANELIANKDDPAKYAKSYNEALKILPAPRLAELGFKPPAAPGTAANMAKQGVSAVAPSASAPSKADALGNNYQERAAALTAKMQSAAADPDLIELDQQRVKALRSGNPVAANNAIAQFNALKKQRYGL